jgi:hypothetical protein
MNGVLEAGRHPASHIVFWLNEQSTHLSAWVRALAAVEGVRATVVVEREISAGRQALALPRKRG